jgi:hypothetical protein
VNSIKAHQLICKFAVASRSLSLGLVEFLRRFDIDIKKGREQSNVQLADIR